MNATSAAAARIAGVAIVLILAAALGLIVGNVLNARAESGPGAGAGGPGLPHMGGFDGARYASQQDDDASVGTPSYADPHLLIQQAAADAAAGNSLQTWGNVDERNDASASGRSSARESLTAPTPR